MSLLSQKNLRNYYLTDLLIIVMVLLNSQLILAQDILITPTVNTAKVPDYFNAIYNYRFNDAYLNINRDYHGNYSPVEKELISANYYWWLIISGENTQENQVRCNNYLNDALNKLQTINDKDLNEINIFSFIYAYAYKARLEIYNSRNIIALMHLYSAMKYIEVALLHSNENDKYKFISGLYNYFVAYIIDKYPIFYPYFFLYPKGDMTKGLIQLEACSKSPDILVKTEALYFLMKIQLEFEENKKLAQLYAKRLTHMYQNNLTFQYYDFKSSLSSENRDTVLSKFNLLNSLADKNQQLNQIQKNHFSNIAKIDIQNSNLNISNPR